MTAKAALAQALLDGRVLNVKNCFQTIGLTNCAREISRMIEKPFGVTVSRTQREGKSKYGQPVTWMDYRLNHTDYNKDGIEKMREYVKQQAGTANPKTDKEMNAIKEAGITAGGFESILNHDRHKANQPKLFQ
jgi:hypothetical protein